MATHKRKGQGSQLIAVKQPQLIAVKGGVISSSAGPSAPGSTNRPTTPFFGEGQQVSLTREPGYTPSGKLTTPFKFMLPPHEAITKTAAHNWSNYDVVGDASGPSERSRDGGRRLKTVAINAMFMDWEPWWAVWNPGLEFDPVNLVADLVKICDQGLRFRFRVRNPQLFGRDDVNMIATLTQVTVTEEPGEPDTRYVQCQFQEYRPTAVERKTVHNVLGPWTHTIKDGDTLYSLSKHYYKSKSQWPKIAHANHGLENQPPSANLLTWSKKHGVKKLKIPALAAPVPVAMGTVTGTSQIIGGAL